MDKTELVPLLPIQFPKNSFATGNNYLVNTMIITHKSFAGAFLAGSIIDSRVNATQPKN